MRGSGKELCASLPVATARAGFCPWRRANPLTGEQLGVEGDQLFALLGGHHTGHCDHHIDLPAHRLCRRLDDCITATADLILIATQQGLAKGVEGLALLLSLLLALSEIGNQQLVHLRSLLLAQSKLLDLLLLIPPQLGDKALVALRCPGLGWRRLRLLGMSLSEGWQRQHQHSKNCKHCKNSKNISS